MTLKDRVWQVLKTLPYPGYSRDLVSFGLVQRVAASEGAVTLSLAIGHLSPEAQQAIVAAVRTVLESLPGVKTLQVEVGQPAETSRAAPRAPQRPESRHVLAVGSGKGGVGKSTLAVNLAVALAHQGLRIGLMDADVYGPNVPRMIGVEQLPPPQDGKIIPAEAHGIRVVSIGFLVEPDTPLVWRGPRTDALIRQFLTDVAWGELDVLLVDLPPGTGDIPLSLNHYAKPDGAIIVVTPQEVALDDARKTVSMFRQLEVPILGLVENMSYFVCNVCSTHHDLFGHGGGGRLAQDLGVPFLGEVPMEPAVCEGGDRGRPAVFRPGSAAGAALQAVAERVWRHLAPTPPPQALGFSHGENVNLKRS